MANTTSPIHQGLVVFAKNKQRVSAFYRETLGLAVLEQAAGHDLLQGAGIEVVVHSIPRKQAATITISQPPLLRESQAMKPTFVVDSLERVRAAAEATGGGLKPLAGAWHIRGATVLDGHDPEGNVVQFKQLSG